MASIKERFDVVIVGAGPAGLVTAAILAFFSAKKVLILEKGEEIGVREALGERAWVEGVGGAGLYSDGKLCMSLDVGGHLREELPPAEKSRLLGALNVLFRWALDESLILDTAVSPRSDRVDGQGVTVSNYPVLHIGTDRGAKVICNIVELIRTRGVAIRSGSELLAARREQPNGWELTVACGGSRQVVHAESLILAMGKVGAQRQAELCEHHGATLVSVPMYVGARFECDSPALRPLFEESLDPKIKLCFPDGTCMKTHCATLQGEIAPLHYEGLPLAGGHGYTDRDTGRGGFAILWDGIRGQDNFVAARDLMGAISRQTQGRLMVQRLADFLRGRESSIGAVHAARPSVAQWSVGNIREFYPQSFFERLQEFLQVIEERVPGLGQSNGLLFAPAIEWWMRRVVADPRSMRSGAGIYICGDGSGWSGDSARGCDGRHCCGGFARTQGIGAGARWIPVGKPQFAHKARRRTTFDRRVSGQSQIDTVDTVEVGFPRSKINGCGPACRAWRYNRAGCGCCRECGEYQLAGRRRCGWGHPQSTGTYFLRSYSIHDNRLTTIYDNLIAEFA